VSAKIDKTMAKHLARSKKAGARLNLRLARDLLVWVKDYATRNNTSVTWLIDDYLRDLRKKDTEVPQI